MIDKKYINELSKRVYEQNVKVGWWDDPDRCQYETMQLVSSEVAEATEGARKDLMDDKIKDRRMEEVEMADTLIRMVDFGGHHKLLYDDNAPFYAIHEDFRIAKCHWFINKAIFELNPNYPCAIKYSSIIKQIIVVSAINNYDLKGATEEKLLFNSTRSDHQRANREIGKGPSF